MQSCPTSFRRRDTAGILLIQDTSIAAHCSSVLSRMALGLALLDTATWINRTAVRQLSSWEWSGVSSAGSNAGLTETDDSDKYEVLSLMQSSVVDSWDVDCCDLGIIWADGLTMLRRTWSGIIVRVSGCTKKQLVRVQFTPLRHAFLSLNVLHPLRGRGRIHSGRMQLSPKLHGQVFGWLK